MKKPLRLLILSTTLGIVGASFANISFLKKNKITCDEAGLPENYDSSLEVVECKPAYNSVDQYYNWQSATTAKQAVAYNHLGNISKVWDKTKGEGTRIAIIDSGIDADHPDFKYDDGTSKIDLDCARYYANVTGDSTSGYTVVEGGGTCLYFEATKSYKINGKSLSGKEVIAHNGDTSHGTNTASTAASAANPISKTGCIGMAPMATIIPIKVDMYSNSIYYALQYLHSLNTDSDPNNNIDVVNISIVGYDLSNTYYNAVTQPLFNDKTIIVASAGNDTKSDLAFPAADRYVIGVGALEDDSSTDLASYSNFNSLDQTESTLCKNTDLVAPGKVYCADYNAGSTYKNNHGTSFASPIVAGAACLWKSLNKAGTVSNFKEDLFSSCVDLGDSGWDTTFGAGRLDIGELIGISDIVSTSSVSLGESVTVKPGEFYQLTPEISPSNATSKDYLWWSETESVATVDSNGLVKGIKEGTAVIHCKSMQNDNAKDTCTVTVANDSSGEEETSTSYKVVFTADHSNKGTSGYTSSTTTSYTQDNFTVNLVGFNNNSNQWGYVKCLGKGDYTATLQNASAISDAVNTIKLTISSVSSITNITSCKLYYGTSSTYNSNTLLTSFTPEAKTFEFGISNTIKNGYYTFEFVGTKASSNGLIAITDIEYICGGSSSGGDTTKSLSSISVSNNHRSFAVGSSFVKEDVTANFNDGTHSDVTNDATFSTPDMSTKGTKTINVSYTYESVTKSTSYSISVFEQTQPDDYGTYYSTIDVNSSTLLADLRTLNLKMRTSTVSYSSMGTSPSGMFKYTDYDPATVKYDDKGQPYGTAILSFYSGKSCTSWNREHVWPNSRGGGSGGSAGAPYPDADIFMPRPTITEENSNRGNSKYVEGIAHSSNGWDPVTAFGNTLGVYPGIRGECARIIFYCMTVNSNLVLDDTATGGTLGKTMGKLSDLLKWNLENPVNDREVRRQSGGQYLQGNRNAFVDHPEYACKIWGNYNDATKKICGQSSQKTLTSITLSGSQKTEFSVGETFSYSGLVVTAHYSDNTTATVTPTSVSTPDMNSAGQKTVTVTYTDSTGTKTDTYTITVKSSGVTPEPEKHTTALSLDKTTATIKVGENLTLTATKTPSDSVDGISWSTDNSSIATVSNGVVTGVSAGTATITATSNGIPATCLVEVKSQSTSSTVTASIDFTNTNDSYKDSAGNTWTGAGGTKGSYYRLDNANSITSSSIPIDTSKTIDLSLYIGSYGSGTKTLSAYAINSSGTVVTNTVSMSPTSTSSNKFTGTLTFNNTSDSNIKIVFKTTSGSIRFYKGDITYTPLPVGPQVTSISLNESELTFDLYNDATPKTLTATIEADEGADKTITWTSSNEAIATVVDGVVTPHSEGNATITATSKANPEVKDTCTVSVTDSSPKPVTGITLNKTNLQLVIGSNFTLVCTITPSNATNKNVTWSSNNESVATVSNGVVTSKAVGSATITVTTVDGGFTANCSITVSAAPVITYQLEADQETVPYMSGTNHQVSVGVKLYQYSNGVKGSQVASNTGSVDTSVLGPAKISYTYQSVTYETSVKVTNKDAKIGSIPDVKVSGENFSATMPDNWNSVGCGEYATNNAPYLLKMDTTGDYFEYLPKNFSSNSKTVNANVTLKMIGGASSSSFTVYALVKDGSGTIVTSSNIKSTISISGKQNDVKTNLSCTLNNSNGDTIYGIRYVFTKGSNVGVSSAEITFKGVQGDATSQEQANAWSDYFIKLTGGGEFDGPCKLGTPEAKKAALQQVWGELKSEYVYMVEGSKAAFCSTDATETIAEAVQHYRYIVNTYGLEDFAEVPQVSNSNRLIPLSDSEPFIIGIIAMVGLAAIGACFVYKRRRE